MTETETLDEFITLAGKGPRKVATPEGAKRYGQPIGTIITPDMELKAKGSKPSGMDTSKGVTGGKSEKATTVSSKGSTSSVKSVSSSDTSPAFESTTLAPLKGPNKFSVGGTTYSAPKGSKKFVANNGGAVIIRTPDGDVRMYNQDGPVEIPEHLQDVMKQKFSSSFSGDQNYTPEDFEEEDIQDLATLNVGDSLHKNGIKAFTKTDDGQWTNDDLGIKMTDSDLQGMFDKGEYELVKGHTESVDYSGMTAEALEEALSNLESGSELYLKDAKLIKQDNGNFKSETTEAEVDPQTLAILSEGTDWLGDKPSGDSVKLDNEENSDLDDEDPLDDLEGSDALIPDEDSAEFALIDESDIEGAYSGAVYYHRNLGALSKIDEDDNTWETLDGRKIKGDSVMDSASKGNISYKPWDDDQKKKYEEFNGELTSEEDSDEETTSETSSPEKTSDETPVPEKTSDDLTDEELLDAIGSAEEESSDDSENSTPEEQEDITSDELTMEEIFEQLDEWEKEDNSAVEDNSTEEVESDSKLSKEDTQSAIDALESHTGFQVAYGLKSLPEDHPLKNKDTLNEIQTEAKKAHPELSPKQALVKHLKGLNGEVVEEEDTDDSNKILIGAKNSKTKNTGLTGGSFTPEEIQEAIDILENFEGKVFKSELNKKGSPLGQLSPNDIVGFNKDKTVTKQKFIDLLKGKIDKHNSSNKEDSSEVVETEAQETPEATSSSLTKGDLLESMEDLETLPNGSKIAFKIDLDSVPDQLYTKKDNKWHFDESDQTIETADFDIAINKKRMYVEYIPNDGPNTSSDEDNSDTPEASPSISFENGHALKDDDSSVKKDGPTGSNPGGHYTLQTEDGPKDFYVKKPKTVDHANNEALANALYKELGVNAPNVDVASDGWLYSEIVDGQQDMSTQLDNPEWLRKVQENFAVDAWLSNRDVFGLTYDNILTDDKGNPWRIDNGGALKYRAQGALKTDFGDKVTELDVFKTGKKSSVFGSDVMSEDVERQSAEKVASISPERIHEMVLDHNMGESLATTLIARRQDIIDRYGLKDPHVPEVEETNAPQVGDEIGPDTDFDSLPVGTKFQDGAGYEFVKNENGNWSEGWYSNLDSEALKKAAVLGTGAKLTHLPSEEGEVSVEEETPNAIAPGKYNSGKGAKAHLWVKSDGTGIYQGMKGKVIHLDAAKVKKNFDAGMSNLVDTPSESTYPDPEKAVVSPGIAGLGSVESLPDGTYWDSKGDIFKVSGDSVEAFIGTNDPKIVAKTSLKTKYLKGQLTDPTTKTTVFPPGFSGEVTYYGGKTSISNLHAYKDYMADLSIPLSEKSHAHTTKFGIALEGAFMQSNLKKKLDIDEWHDAEEKLSAIVKDLEDYLAPSAKPVDAGVDDLFDKDVSGHPILPTSIALMTTNHWNASVSEVNSSVDIIKNSIGDGNVVGHNIKSAPKWQKKAWISAIKSGEFSKAFNIEKENALDKGKPFLAGPSHPGHPSNPETATVVWGSAVPGELPAGDKVPGEWSTDILEAPSAEIDNYLIAAKMQNPTYLSKEEKRSWAYHHISGNTDSVNVLSLRAQARKENGEVPLTEEPEWTDDIKPVKVYDSLFHSTDFPQNWNTFSNRSKGYLYYTDHKDSEPELEALYKKYAESDPTGYEQVHIAKALNEWFAIKEKAYLDEKNKPVYQVVKEIEAGSHSVFVVKDQFGVQKIFKPTPKTRLWRASMEANAHQLGKALGLSIPGAYIGSVSNDLPEGHESQGIIMDFAENVGSFGDIDGKGTPIKLSDLSAKQFGQLAAEHVGDWILDNDDTHKDNILMGASGQIISIDKGRAFVQYGHWNGLDVDNPENLNVNTRGTSETNVFYDMIQAIKSGEISQDQMDAAYFAATKQAKKINKRSDSSIQAYIENAVEDRTDWEVPDYAKNWPTLHDAPQSKEELVQAVLNRKNSIVEDIDEMWTKLYSYSGHKKPEAPDKALGDEHLSGWDEADLTEKVEAAKVWGAPTIHSSAAIEGGAALLWTEKDGSGDSYVNGKFTLGNISQQKVLDFLKTKVNTDPYQSQTVEGYPSGTIKTWKSTVTLYAKDVSANATTQNYTQQFEDNAKHFTGIVDEDLQFAKTVDINSSDAVTFPSSNVMPGTTVPQYIMALQHHKSMMEKVEQAKAQGVTTNKEDFKDYVPVAWKSDPQTYVSPDKSITYKELTTGSFLKTENGSTELVSSVPEEVLSPDSGYTTTNSVSPLAKDPEVYTYSSAGMYAGSVNADGEKVVTTEYTTSGNPGSEYRVDLPTGEVIYFRNSYSTNTVKSQRGTVRFILNKDSDSSESLSHVQTYLNKWGLDMSGADEDTSESVYWRQMFGTVLGSNGEGASPEVLKAKQKLLDMKKDLSAQLGVSIENRDIPEAIGLTQSNEREFWNNLATETWGVDRVNTFISEGGHLPKYQHLDLADTEKSTGLPYYDRIDVSVEDLLKENTLLALGNKGKDNSLLKYLDTGSLSSTEERLRLLGTFKQGASSGEDQQKGGGSSVFLRVAKGSNETKAMGNLGHGDHVAYFNPKMLTHTTAYGWDHDHYGATDYMESGNPYSSKEILSNTGNTNEVMTKHNVSMFDYLEVMVFESEKKRQEAIDKLKKKGIEMLRGIPIEERLIMRQNLVETLKKVKAKWS